MTWRVPLRLVWPTGPGAFRLWLAMLVFVHHFSSLDVGPSAVYVFFALSGFWLQGMWMGRYRDTRQPYLTYMVSRVWRLAPVMILVSAFTIPVLLAIGAASRTLFSNAWHLAFSSVFLLGYAALPQRPVGSAWSLDVEMQFYLVAPLIAAWLARKRAWPVVVAAAVLSAAAALFVEATVLPRYAIFFVAGMAASAKGWQPPRWLALASALAFVPAVVGIALSPWRSLVLGGSHVGPLFVWNPLLDVVLGVVAVPFALYTVRQPSDAADRMLADLSYIVYLVHWPAMQWFFTLAGRPFAQRLAGAALCFAVVPAISLVIWRWFDKPLNRARGRWVSSRLPLRRDGPPPATEAPPIAREPAGP